MDLGSHQRVGKKLVSPATARGNFIAVASWPRAVVPHIAWMGCAAITIDDDVLLARLFVSIAKAVLEQKQSVAPLLCGNWQENEIAAVRTIAKPASNILQMSRVNDLPSWVFPAGEGGWSDELADRLSTVLAEMRSKTSALSARVIAHFVGTLQETGRLRFAKGLDSARFEDVFSHPAGSNEYQMAAGFGRAVMSGFAEKGMGGDFAWPNRFWTELFSRTSCMCGVYDV